MTILSDAFFTLHSGLQREGPGDSDSLSWALEVAGTPARARILDAGCGPGADLALLSDLRPGAILVGRDLHAPFIDRIRADLPHVIAECGDMLTPDGQFDLIWSAGAAYAPGIAAALTAWRPHLRPSGSIAFSDALWRTGRPSPPARAFWQAEYPQMCDLPQHLERIEGLGWRIKGARWLGDVAWESYYLPLQNRINALRPSAEVGMTAVLEEAQAEIDIWRTYGAEFGYYLTVVQPA
jgi:SAM-dependent methyltransferase